MLEDTLLSHPKVIFPRDLKQRRLESHCMMKAAVPALAQLWALAHRGD